jgi:NADH-quinone oxidoreductase subunit M
MLRAYRQTVFGNASPVMANILDLSKSEAMVLIPICILILVIGIYPAPILQLAQEPVNEIIKNLNVFKVIPGVTP